MILLHTGIVVLLQTLAAEGATAGDLMSNDNPGTGHSRATRPAGPGAAGVSPAWLLGCPAWCDGQHQAGDDSPAWHGRIVAQQGDASVTLSGIGYDDQAETGGTVIILGADTMAGRTELAESDAIRLLGTLEAAAEGPSWLGDALRSALELLDPGAGWTRTH